MTNGVVFVALGVASLTAIVTAVVLLVFDIDASPVQAGIINVVCGGLLAAGVVG